MKYTGISSNIMECATFWLSGGLYAPMVENVDIPKGFLVVLEAPWTGIYGYHKKYGFYGKIPEFCDFPLFYIKILKICDFPLFGVQGASKTTNNP
jgi:hypothetical protein